MGILQLQYFLSICDEGSIAAASKKLSVTTSALSQALKQMEKELGFSLFDRVSNRLKLNRNGEMLRTHAKVVLQDYAEILNTVNSFTDQPVSIGICSDSSAMFRYCLPLLISHFPDYQFTGRQMPQTEIRRVLNDGTFDLAITLQTAPGDEAFRALPVGFDCIYAVVPLVLPLSKKRAVSLAELRGYPIIMTDPNTTTSQRIVSLLYDACGKEQVIRMVEDYGVYRRIVGTTEHYVSFVTNIGLNYYDVSAKCVLIPVNDPSMLNQINLVYKRSEEKRLAPVLDYLQSSLHDSHPRRRRK